jgi:hypothetical protein
MSASGVTVASHESTAAAPPQGDRVGRLAGLLLGAAFAVAWVLWIVRSVPAGHSYEMAAVVTGLLLLVWFFHREGERVLGSRTLLAIFFVLGLAVGVGRALTLEHDPEITQVYRTLFATLEQGENPYAVPTIYHRTASGAARLGTFNYPPLEIAPYYLLYKVLGVWNDGVLVAALIAMQVLVCATLKWTFPSVPTARLAAFFPWFVFFEFTTNVATSFLLVALVVKAMEAWSADRDRMLLLPVLFGLGLLTKFLTIPIFAAYYAYRIRHRGPRGLPSVARDMAIVGAVVLAGVLPFGVENVLDSTLGFNLDLAERGRLTTFTPNVLTAVLHWLGLPELYGVVAVTVLITSVVMTPTTSPYAAMLWACYAFMIAVPTPEGQFLPVILYLAVAGVLSRNHSPHGVPAAIEVRAGDSK